MAGPFVDLGVIGGDIDAGAIAERLLQEFWRIEVFGNLRAARAVLQLAHPIALDQDQATRLDRLLDSGKNLGPVWW